MKKLYIALLQHIFAMGGRVELQDFLGSFHQAIFSSSTDALDYGEMRERVFVTLAQMQDKGWINCYQPRGPNEYAPVKLNNQSGHIKMLDITLPGLEQLESKAAKSAIPKEQVIFLLMEKTPQRKQERAAKGASEVQNSFLVQKDEDIQTLVEAQRTKVPVNIGITQIVQSIAGRQGQSAFRDGLMSLFSCKCCVTDCDVKLVLEAAHIDPYHATKEHDLWNGLILRPDIHTLFDLYLISVKISKGLQVFIALHSALRENYTYDGYKELHNKALLLPDLLTSEDNKKRTQALERHWNRCVQKYGESAFIKENE